MAAYGTSRRFVVLVVMIAITPLADVPTSLSVFFWLASVETPTPDLD